MKLIILSFVLFISLISFGESFAINNKPAKDKNVAIVQNLYAAFTNGDVAAILQKFDPKV